MVVFALNRMSRLFYHRPSSSHRERGLYCILATTIPRIANPTNITNYGSTQTTANNRASESSKRKTDKSHYLHTYITLTIIQQKVLLSLYSPRTAVQSWQVRVLSLQMVFSIASEQFLIRIYGHVLTSMPTVRSNENHGVTQGTRNLGADGFTT